MVTRWLTRMRDGTVKQVNAFTGTQVWTVPGRGDRPLVTAERAASPLAPGDAGRMCAFCSQRYVETPPEIARIVHEGDAWRTMRQVGAADLDRSVAAFRLVPNLFEIMSLDYWRDNHGYVLPEAELARRRAYLRDPQGVSRSSACSHAAGPPWPGLMTKASLAVAFSVASMMSSSRSGMSWMARCSMTNSPPRGPSRRANTRTISA